MPQLFESFVAEWIKTNAPPGLAARTQHKARLDASARLTFRIDIVLKSKKSGETLAVLDTKYKAGERPLESDIQQVVAYAVEMGTDRAFLIYPSQNHLPIRATVGHISVESIVFDLGKDYDKEGPRFLRDLITRLALKE